MSSRKVILSGNVKQLADPVPTSASGDYEVVPVEVMDGVRELLHLPKGSEIDGLHFALADCAYDVRDHEQSGWEGPAVTRFSEIVSLIEAYARETTP